MASKQSRSGGAVASEMPRKVDRQRLYKTIGWSPWTPKVNPLQVEVIEAFETYPRHLAMCGRQLGKSMLAAALALEHLLSKDQAIWIVAPEYDLTRRIWDYLDKWVSTYFADLVQVNKSTLSMKSIYGSTVECKSIESGNLIGKSLSGLIIDEAARIPPEMWWGELHPTLDIRGGWAFLISTPRGKNWFYQEWLKGRQGVEGYKSYHYPSSSSPYYPPEALARAKAQMPEKIFNQEHLAIPEESGGTVFPASILTPVIRGETEVPRQDRVYGIGIDLAKYEDFTACCVMDLTTGHVVALDRFNSLDYPTQIRRIKTVITRWSTYEHAKVIIDSTGVGVPVVDQLRRDGVSLTPFHFRGFSKQGKPTKADLIEHLRLAIDQQRISLPRIPTLVQELEVFSYHQAETTVKYEAPSGFHDDCVIALGLVTWLLGPTTRDRLKSPPKSLTLIERLVKYEHDYYAYPDQEPVFDQPAVMDYLDWN